MSSTREPFSPAGHACPQQATIPIPTVAERQAAWLALPTETRDRIGLVALDMVFNAFLSGAARVDEGRLLGGDLVAIREASDACDEALMLLHEVIESALPDLFGEPNTCPAWAAQH